MKTWPAKVQETHYKVHWPSREDNSVPACKQLPSYFHKPEIATHPERVTCMTCKRWAEKFQ